MNHVEGERPAADPYVKLQTIPLEDLVVPVDGLREVLVEKIEIVIGQHGMAADVHQFDWLPVTRFLAHQDSNIDPACIIALDQVFLNIAVADHAKQIAVFEGMQRRHVVDFLQAEDVCVRIGNRQGGKLARVVRGGNHTRLLHLLVGLLVGDVVEAQHPVLSQLVAKAGKIEAGDEVFDVERGEADRHELSRLTQQLCPLGASSTIAIRLPARHGPSHLASLPAAKSLEATARPAAPAEARTAPLCAAGQWREVPERAASRSSIRLPRQPRR